MDEDYDTVLVIDVDDERNEMQDSRNIDEEIRPINGNKCNLNKNEIHEKQRNEEKFHVQQQNNGETSDDDIQVIDDDEDYEIPVRKLVDTANEIGREYLQNELLDEARYHRTTAHNSGPSQHDNRAMNEARRNAIRDHGPYKKTDVGKNQVNTGVTRDPVIRCIDNNKSSERLRYKPYKPRYESRYLLDPPGMNDDTHIPFRPSEYTQNMSTLPYEFETVANAYRHTETNRADVSLSVEEYCHLMNEYEHNRVYKPEIPFRNDLCTEYPMNRNIYVHDLRRDSSTDGCDYSAMIRYQNHRQELIEEEYIRAELNRVPHFHTHGTEDPCLDDYRDAPINRDTYRYINRLNERLVNDNRNLIMNDPYSHYRSHNAFDYWPGIFYGHPPRHEGAISIEDYERLRYCQAYGNTHPPVALGLDAYRSVGFPDIYRPDINDTHRDPMLLRNAYYSETAGMYKTQTNSYRTEIDNANGNNQGILNLSRKPDMINVNGNRSRDESEDLNKLRIILSTGSQMSKSPLNADKATQKYGSRDILLQSRGQTHRTTTDVSNKATLSVNKLEDVQMGVCTPGVPVRTNRPDTVILSTGNIYKSNTLVQSDALATSNFNNSRCHDSQGTNNRDNENHIAMAIQSEKTQKEIFRRKSVDHDNHDREMNRKEIYDRKRFLVVFFTQVRELVKQTFPEFSRSLEIEIKNLGEWTNSGKMKTDIQYICPLYCSVSTYSLPRFDNTEDDNKIEKHGTRAICDVCSCIQNCYKLYKKKYLSLVSTPVERQENDKTHMNEPIDRISGERTQTVIRRLKNPNCEELVVDKSVNNKDMVNEEWQRHPKPPYMTSRKIDSKGVNSTDTINNQHLLASLHEKRLKDSLSVLNFNLPIKYTENTIVAPNLSPRPLYGISLCHNNVMNQKEVYESNTFKDKNELITGNKNYVDMNHYPKEDEANLILSLSYNDISNADIIASKLKDKISKKPDTVFTCHICSCTFTYFTSFVSHMKKEHYINGIDEDIPDECIARKCPFCGIYSKIKYHNEHVKRAHPDIFTHKGEASEILTIGVKKRRKTMKRKFIFTCLVCHKHLKSTEVQKHRENEHKGLKVAKMFTKKLSNTNY